MPRADAFMVGGNARGGKGHIERVAHDVEVTGLGKELREERDVETVVGGLLRPALLSLRRGEIHEQAVDELAQSAHRMSRRNAEILRVAELTRGQTL